VNPISARAVFVEKKGRGAEGLGILERHGKGHTEIVPNAAKKPYRLQSRARWPLEHHHTRRLEGLRWAGG